MHQNEQVYIVAGTPLIGEKYAVQKKCFHKWVTYINEKENVFITFSDWLIRYEEFRHPEDWEVATWDR